MRSIFFLLHRVLWVIWAANKRTLSLDKACCHAQSGTNRYNISCLHDKRLKKTLKGFTGIVSALYNWIFKLCIFLYQNLGFFCNCHPQTCSFGSKPCAQLLIQHHFHKYPRELYWIYDFQTFQNLRRFFETISKPLQIFSQIFGTKFKKKTQPSKQRFSKHF